jgi:SAM-dependent methyltransferase
MFYPGFFAVFINPFYLARKNLVSAIIQLSTGIKGSLIDIGCGTKPYRQIFEVNSYRGLDIDSFDARQKGVADDFYDGLRFPYPDESFDSALCNQVLEHVFNPDNFLSEINRVLRLNGKLLLTIPFVWDEHEQPHDYARYSSFGIQALLEKNGFRVITHLKLGADASIIFQITNAYLYKISIKWPKLPRLFFTLTVMATINILGIIAGHLLPRNADLFLDQAIYAEKVL